MKMLKAKNIQSLINEQKGFLFEFLVAKNLATKADQGESKFLATIDENMWSRLKTYQQAIFAKDKILYQQLPVLAQKCVDYYYNKVFQDQLIAVHLASRGEDQRTSSADLVLDGKKSHYKLSLKLCKSNAYINTKSAGIKSFFQKYFPHSTSVQKKLDQKVFQAFEELRYSLLDSVGLDLSSKQFEEWQGRELTTLPGDLQKHLRAPLLAYYQQCINALFQGLIEIMENQDPQSIHASFLRLCGLEKGVNHLFCFHRGTDNYQLAQVVHLNATEFLKIKPEIIPPSRESSYFLINYKNKMTLQIRVKPMRDFTMPAMKINCAVKLHE